MSKTIAVIGLGLIGGSMALALKGFEDFEIVGVDVSEPTLRFAAEHGVGDRVTADAREVIPQADLTILCLHPKGITRFLEDYWSLFKPGSLVTDVCGVKTSIMEAAEILPPEVDFIGCHPMAGTEFSGIEHAFAEMFQKSHLILTPRESSSAEHIALMERLADHIGCRDVVRTTPEEHDAILAYTSQMMHGFEGSSFRGCTRVAALDVGLWTQLFSMNTPALLAALDRLEENLHAYREAIASGDTRLLSDKLAFSAGRKRKMDLEGPDLLSLD